jgi:oligoendopeptidase F
MLKRLTRPEVPVELTWKVEDIFATPEAWEAELKAVADSVGNITKYIGKLGESPKMLLGCMEAQEALQVRISRVMSYASLNQSADATDPAYQTAMGRVDALMAQIGAATSFIQPEALSLPEGTLERYLKEEPGLDPFRRAIERMIEDKSHLLGPETEKALAALGEVLNAPSMIYQRSKATDMAFDPIVDSKGNTIPMSFSMYESSYETSPDTVLRRNAWASFTKALRSYQNTYGATWGTEVKKNVVMAKLRGFPSAVHMLLDRQEVTLEVYGSLHDVILKEIAPHFRRYAQLRKKVLGLDKMLYCDIEAPLDPEFNPEVTYQEGAQLIRDGIKVMGPEYTEIIANGLRNRWVDLADNVGKSTGASCNSVYGVHPYILITWTNRMRNVLTLSHELGHAGQGVLSQRYQRPANTRPSMFFIEAPSTINETIVGNHILSGTSDVKMRRWLIMQFLMTYYHNFVRHLIEGELQRRTYALAEKGQPITANVLSNVQADILSEFWAGEVEIDDGARLTWMRQPHYYRGLYPYSYSAGLTIGTAVSKAIREEGKPSVDRWLSVLKAGGTRKPIELASMAGVDMTKPDAIRGAVAYVGLLVDEVVKSF